MLGLIDCRKRDRASNCTGSCGGVEGSLSELEAEGSPLELEVEGGLLK